jgi:hypothetical protein
VRASALLALAAVALLGAGGPAVPRSAAAPGGEPLEPPSTLVAPPTAHTFGFRRATQREIGLVLPGTRLVDPAGVAVVRLDATDDPSSRSDDDEITVVAVDRGSGTLLTSFGILRAGKWTGAGTRVGALSHPTDAAIDREGLVGVTDTGNRRVVVLRHDGKTLTPLASYAGFAEPLGIAADGAGGFLVCDRGADAVFRLDARTGARSTFGLEAAFARPVDVAMIPEGEALGPGRSPAVVVADRDGARLRVFDPGGVLRASREAKTLGVPGASFDAVELDLHGDVFAVDRKGNRLHKLSADLYPLATFGSRGTTPGQFLGPRGIAIHRKLGQVLVTEEDGGQYLWIGTDIADFRVRSGRDGVRLEYLLTEESTVVLRILDTAGRAVATVLDEARQREGPQRGTWDGTDASGRRVPAGEYFAEVVARATYASRSSFERRRTERFTLAAPGSSR